MLIMASPSRYSVKKAAESLGGLLAKAVFIGGIIITINMGRWMPVGVVAGLSGVFASFIIGVLLGGLPGLAIDYSGLIRRGSRHDTYWC